MVLPERMFPLTPSHAVPLFHVLATRTKLLHANEVRYVEFSFGRVLGIFGSFEILEDVQYLIASRGQHVLQGSHITQVTYVFILLKLSQYRLLQS